MRPLTAFILLVIFSGLQSQPYPAEAGTTVGQPTGKLKNRYFTHPKAAEVYLNNEHYQRRLSTVRRRSRIGAIERRGHIYVSVAQQHNKWNLKSGELKTVSDLDGVLMTGIKKGTDYAQQ